MSDEQRPRRASSAARSERLRRQRGRARRRGNTISGTQARYRALEEQASRRATAGRQLVAAAGRHAGGAALVALVHRRQRPPTTDEVQAAPLADLEILLGEGISEMLDEELEFYGWLEEQPEFAGDDSVG